MEENSSESALEDLSLEISNIVASGELDKEYDLAVLSSAPEFIENPLLESVEHSRRQGNRLLIRFPELNPLGILAPTSVYVITGAKSFEEMNQAKDDLLTALIEADALSEPYPDNFEIQNLVFTGDIDKELNLNALTIGLGLENVEYEPEQFPGLVYRTDSGHTILIFASGKMVLTGFKNIPDAIEQFEKVREDVQELLSL